MSLKLTLYEQYLNHCRMWLTKYQMSLSEIENAKLEVMLDMEILDSRIEAAFAENKKVYINQIL